MKKKAKILKNFHSLYLEKVDLENLSQRKRSITPEGRISHNSTIYPRGSIPRSTLGSHDGEYEHEHVLRGKSPIKKPKTFEMVWEDNADGTRYEGEKYLGKRHGKGVYYYAEGYKYDGYWEDDLMKGYGTLWYNKDRKLYEGEWCRGKFHGRGMLFNNKTKMVDRTFDGRNFESLRAGWIFYEGSFKDGKKNGIGSVSITNGDKFVGNFVEDIVDGEGSYTIVNGRTILGIWRQNKLESEF